MPKMTVSVPDELLAKLREKYPDTNWAEVARRGIKRKVEELEKFEKLKERGQI